MKYIRTKDEIIEFNTNSTIEAVNDYSIDHYEKDVKVADTIEELCDEFVIIKDKNTLGIARYYSVDKTFYVKTDDEEISLNECLRYKYKIYGAIWTDKGLIYVVKMNEKGELELL